MNQLPTDTTVSIDYNFGYVYTTPLFEGATLTFTYHGSGISAISSNRVWTLQSGGNITQTLADITSAASQFTYIGTYDNAVQYKVYNIVNFQGTSYMCTAVSNGNLPTNTAFFKKLAGNNFQGTYSAGNTYNNGDTVVNATSDVIYVSVIDGNIGQSLTNTAKWTPTISVASMTVAEANRVTAENSRVTVEGNRVSAETGRTNAESSRVTVEGNRVSSENTRISNETTRGTNETARIGRDTAYQLIEAYNSSHSYVPLNKVTYNGSCYQNILASTNNIPTNTTYWIQIAAAGSVASVSSTNADITVANPTSSPTLTLNSSVAATPNSIVKRDSSGNVNEIGILSNLTTLDKSSLVNSQNEEISRRKDFGINAKDYYASGSLQTTTGSITSGTNTLTLASALDFQNSQGINVNGIKEVASLSVTAGATTSANCTISLNGVATTVALTSGNTATQVATAIRATSFSGWTTGGSTTTVTFTSSTTGTKTDATFSAGTTGATGTMTTTTQGTADLITTIQSGAGTTSLTLAANATTTATGSIVSHDDTNAFQNIEAATGQVVYLPDGTYIVSGITLTKRYTGIGKIKLNGTIQANNYVSIHSLPTTGANSGDYFGGDQKRIDSEYFEIATGIPVSTVTSNYYNWELQPHLTNFWVNSGYSGMTTKTTGSNASGQAVVNVRNTSDLTAGIQVLIGSDTYTISLINSSTQFTTTTNLITTYAASTTISKGNRTMFDDYFSNLFHLAGGDAYSYISRVVAGKAPDADQTHFSYNSTAGIIGGDLTGTTSGVYMTGTEMNFLDSNYLGSHDIAVVGDVRSFQRTNATGALGCVWVGTLYKSEGTQYGEGAHVVTGKWKGGLDLAWADFGTDMAAIKLAHQQRIYFDSSGTTDEAGYQMWSNTVGTTYLRYQNLSSQMQSWVGGVNALSWTSTDLYAGTNIHAGNTGSFFLSTNNQLYLDGGTNTYLKYDGTNIKLFKAGVQVATW